MRRHALFVTAILGLVAPLHAQQRTDADEAAITGNVQRAQAAQFPAIGSLSMSTRATNVSIEVSADADGICWASRRGKRVVANQVRVLGPMWHGSVISVLADHNVPANCLYQVVATLKSNGYRKLIPATASN
ncbi:hypothetical protein PX554_03030 [Sphingomonas sp. H39-1-10]|uniref:hypothetical protein n=1 Tax=Sphingomonas pollutisoli TaxID=3030829 RepID=UPI0023B9CDE0|nr:hypothetical protein [Sphingomonas pollutisoli]MDF0487093.1 hypothetical protein [Sphingomonas pollutisoli]